MKLLSFFLLCLAPFVFGQTICGWLTCGQSEVCCNGDASNPACVQRGQACIRPTPRCNSSSDCGTREICCPGANCLNAHCLGAGLNCPALCISAPTEAPTSTPQRCTLPCPFEHRCCIGCDGPYCQSGTECPLFRCASAPTPAPTPALTPAPAPTPITSTLTCGWLTCDETTQRCCNGDAANPACVPKTAACLQPVRRCNSTSTCGPRKKCCPGDSCLNAHCVYKTVVCSDVCTAPPPPPASSQKCGWLTCNTDQRCCNGDASNPACVSRTQMCLAPIPRCNATQTCASGERCCPGGGCLNAHCIPTGQACPLFCTGNN